MRSVGADEIMLAEYVVMSVGGEELEGGEKRGKRGKGRGRGGEERPCHQQGRRGTVC